jgi:hypothetical protein
MSAPSVSGHDAGIERDARHAVAEMRAVADVGLEAHRQRLLDDRVQLALLVDEAAGMARDGCAMMSPG